MKSKTTSWDEAMSLYAEFVAQAPLQQQQEAWNRLQRRASDNVGIPTPGRLPWPEALLHCTPDDLLAVVEAMT